MLTFLLWVIGTVHAQILIPWQWFINLPFDWQFPLVGTLVLIICRKQVIIRMALARYLIGEWHADQSYEREWNHYARMDGRQFRDEMEKLQRKAESEGRYADVLEQRARQSRFKRVQIPGGADTLHEGAEKFRQKMQHLTGEVARLKKLRAEIEKQRDAQGGGTRDRVIALMNRLHLTTEYAASDALAQLNRIAMSFDWDSLIPLRMPDATHKVMVKALRLMASTSSVEEARTAYGRILHMLEGHRMTWRDMAA
jgi:hypothetical protein